MPPAPAPPITPQPTPTPDPSPTHPPTYCLCSLIDTLSQMVHLAIIAGLYCSHLSRYIWIELQMLIVLFESMTNWASLFTQPTEGNKLAWIAFSTVQKVIMQYRDSWKSLLKATEIWSHPSYRHGVEDMDKEEITSVQYHHKCHSISTLKKMLKAYLKLSTPWAYDALHIFCTRSRKCLKDQSTRQPFIQYSELHVDQQIWKAASI